MLNTSDPLVKIGITSVVCTVPAIATTIYRLYIRRGRYWADDAWALMSAATQLVMFSGSFIHITESSPRLSMIAAYYMMASAFYTVVWFARLSILFSIIRIHPSEVIRQRLLYVAALFFVTTAVLVSQLYWVCELQPGWKEQSSPQCELPRQVVILQLVTDVISDAILVVVPLRLIQTLSDKKLRRRLAVIFSTCLITTTVSLVHAAFIFTHEEHQEVIAAIVEDCVSLIVCNVPVVATVLIRNFGGAEDRNKKSRLTNVSLKFATISRTRNTATSVAVSTIGATTTTGTETAWFRWERELEPESSGNDTSTAVSSDVELTGTTRRPDRVDIAKPRSDNGDVDSEFNTEYPSTKDSKTVYWVENDP